MAQPCCSGRALRRSRSGPGCPGAGFALRAVPRAVGPRLTCVGPTPGPPHCCPQCQDWCPRRGPGCGCTPPGVGLGFLAWETGTMAIAGVWERTDQMIDIEVPPARLAPSPPTAPRLQPIPAGACSDLSRHPGPAQRGSQVSRKGQGLRESPPSSLSRWRACGQAGSPALEQMLGGKASAAVKPSWPSALLCASVSPPITWSFL